MRDVAPTPQECHVVETDGGIEIGRSRRVRKLLLSKLDRSAALVCHRQLQHEIGRPRLIVECLTQVGNGGVELPALHSKGGTKLQAANIAAVLAENIGHEDVNRIELLLAELHLRQLDLCRKSLLGGAPGPGQIFEQLEAVLEFALAELKLRQRNLILENLTAGVDARFECLLTGRRAFGGDQESHHVQASLDVVGIRRGQGPQFRLSLIEALLVYVEFDKLLPERGFLRVQFDKFPQQGLRPDRALRVARKFPA